MRNNKLTPAHSFKRDLKKQSFELFLTPEWAEVIDCLNNGKKMSKERLDHDLKHDWKGCRECHIKPDLLLIYEYKDAYVLLHRIGSHSELFG
ncbi:MAG: type II toxin-antitoxin system YafQ family toxin [Neisseriaceae bacterium]|nr:type II toxin-antitoxin system YafQ family toxin [Neisseriaceae bacterium]